MARSLAVVPVRDGTDVVESLDRILPPLEPHPPDELIRHLIRQSSELCIQRSQREVRRSHVARVEMRGVDRFVVGPANEIGRISEGLGVGVG